MQGARYHRSAIEVEDDAGRRLVTLRKANELCQRGELQAARALCEEVLRLEPRSFTALHLMGVMTAQAGAPAEAVALIDRALAVDPSQAAAHYNRGNVLQILMRWDVALASYDRAILINPQFAQAYSNRGVALTAVGCLSDALASFDRAIALRPDYAEAYVGRGNAYKELNQLDEALASYDRAILLRADYAEAYFCRAITLLLCGDFKRGWVDYEWRWRMPRGAAGGQLRDLRQPLWHGGESIAGKTVLIYCEKGLGDTLQFCRYVKLVSDLGARVILQVQRPLVDLLSNLDGASRVVEEGDSRPDFDWHSPLLSLPLAFSTELGTIPAAGKYLSADPGKVAKWRAALAERDKPRVGLAWRGDPNSLDDRNRSIALQDLLRQLPPDFQYFSLQKEVTETERRIFQESLKSVSIADELDFTDTAALCECLDLVISVDTSVAHLSGSLGARTWILLPFSPDCRWLLNRADSPWYPTVTLYRQERSGDWSGVLARVGADLTRELAPPS